MNNNRRLADAIELMPVGSKFGYWQVTETPFTTGKSGIGILVPVRCTFIRYESEGECGTEATPQARRLLRGEAKACRVCNKWKGEFYPRPPWMFRDECLARQQGVCAWPPCSKPLNGDVHIDHNRLCCTDSFTCGRCVRGAVHKLCNTWDIASCDLALSFGAKFPAEISDYLAIGGV